MATMMMNFPTTNTHPLSNTQQHEQQHQYDYAVWFEWASMARAQLRSRLRRDGGRGADDLLDSYVDPVVANHMSLDAAAAAAGSKTKMTNHPVEEQQSKLLAQSSPPPKLVRRTPRKLAPPASGSSLLPRVPNIFATSTPAHPKSSHHHGSSSSNPLQHYSNNNATSVPAAAATTVSQQPEQPQTYRWPNMEEVERALAGCRVESDLFVDGGSNNNNQSSSPHDDDDDNLDRSLSSVSTLTTTAYGPPEVGEPATAASHPIRNNNTNNPQQPPPPPLGRVTTSTILGEQNELLQQFQLERQEYVLPAVVPPPAESRYYSTTTTSRTNTPVSRYHQHSERESRSPYQRRPRGGEWNTTPAARTKTSHHPKAPATTTTTHSARPRSVIQNHPSQSQPQFYRRSKPQSVGATAVAATPHHSKLETKQQQPPHSTTTMSTVPCIECQAPLKLPTTASAASSKTVVYCPTCGTMASADLMRTLLLQADSDGSGSKNNPAASRSGGQQ